MTPQIAITGGRGRWAPVVAERMAAEGYQVVLFSRKAGGKFQSLSSLLDASVLSELGAILHFGWGTVPKTSEAREGAEWKGDLPFLSRLLRAAAALPVDRRPHFVFPSTGAVYGDCSEKAATEDDLPNPKSYYASAKLAAEDLLRAYGLHGKGPVTILRVTNLYGRPDAGSKPQGLVARLHACHRDRRSPEIWGDGQATKDFLHEEDFLQALRLCLEKKLTGLWNLASGKPVSVLALMKICEKEWDWRPRCRFLPAPSWDVQRTAISPARFCQASGWHPQVDLSEGIRRMGGMKPPDSPARGLEIYTSEKDRPPARV